ELMEVLLVEAEGLPLAERRRAAAQGHDDVDDRAAAAAHELGHAVADLEVHAAEDAVAGSRVVVLHELLGDAELRVDLAAVALVEEAAVITGDPRADENRALEACFKPLHAR